MGQYFPTSFEELIAWSVAMSDWEGVCLSEPGKYTDHQNHESGHRIRVKKTGEVLTYGRRADGLWGFPSSGAP